MGQRRWIGVAVALVLGLWCGCAAETQRCEPLTKTDYWIEFIDDPCDIGGLPIAFKAPSVNNLAARITYYKNLVLSANVEVDDCRVAFTLWGHKDRDESPWLMGEFDLVREDDDDRMVGSGRLEVFGNGCVAENVEVLFTYEEAVAPTPWDN